MVNEDGHVQKGLIKSSLGNFGHFAYGNTIQGRVHYPINNTDGCRPFTEQDFKHIKTRGNRDHLIIMVDRGTCHFVKKAQNIQAFGGVMMIVVDSKFFENVDNLIMADDGNGESIYIPSFLIGYHDGAKIKSTIHIEDRIENNLEGEAAKRHRRNGNRIVMRAVVDLAQQTNGMIQVDLWYSGAYELMQVGLDFKKYAEMQEIFKHKVKFQPRTMTTSCTRCKTGCVANGNYCPVVPFKLRAQNVW